MEENWVIYYFNVGNSHPGEREILLQGQIYYQHRKLKETGLNPSWSQNKQDGFALGTFEHGRCFIHSIERGKKQDCVALGTFKCRRGLI